MEEYNRKRKWGLLLLCAGFLTVGGSVAAGCTRYTPVETPAEEKMETEPLESTGSASEESVLGITDEDDKMEQKPEPVKVKGIYVSAHVAGNEEMMDSIIEQIDATELNAVVIDFKTDEGYIAAQTDSALLAETGACRDFIPDLAGLMKKLQEHDIYAIARVVAFRDPFLTEQKPEWSLKRADGSLYRDKSGLAWVDPYNREVWDYLVETGIQAARAGFDEIQFDYIRFSTDSTMRQVVFDETLTEGKSRTEIITEFTSYAAEALRKEGVFVAADVFGAIIGSPQDAGAVGQIYGQLAEELDYICPMIYPSHYGDGNFGLDHPDLHPYETILGALQKSREELAMYGAEAATPAQAELGQQGRESEKAEMQTGEIKQREDQAKTAVVRPWLQDFTASYLKHYQKYGDEEIRQQIQAVYDAGYEEWILWNAANQYHYGGLLHE